jgi:quercetin dioxygenase-like cupin family protein
MSIVVRDNPPAVDRHAAEEGAMRGEEAQPIRRSPGEGPTVVNPLGGPLVFKVLGHQTRGLLTVFESTAAPGEGPPLHLHVNEDEVVYVLEGTLRFKLGDDTQPAPSGAFVYIPRGEPHTWQNIGEAPARFLAIFTPAAPGMEGFFDRFPELADDMPLTNAFQALGAAAGMRVLGPPLAESQPL